MEDRRLLANIAVTDAFLTDGEFNPIPHSVVGERVAVRVNYTTDALPANASYRVAFTVNGVTLDFDNRTSGAGLGAANSSAIQLAAGWRTRSGPTL